MLDMILNLKEKKVGVYVSKANMKNNYPLVSVLIPVYQAESYLERCINSVLNQTYSNIEIILVDDGSTDKSASIGATFSNREEVSYTVIEHEGVSKVREELVKLSRGEYLFFLDSDDFIDPETIRMLCDMALEYSADIVQCNMMNTSGSDIRQIDFTQKVIRTYSSRQALYDLQCGYGVLRCMLAAKLYKREILEKVSFPVGKIHEDEFTMHWIFANCNKIVSTQLPLYYYYQNNDSITKGNFTYSRYDILEAIQDRIVFCRERKEYFAANLNCLRYCFWCIRLYRQTYYEIDKEDSHLITLYQNFRNMAKYLLSIDCLENEIQNLLCLWIQNPMSGDIPNFWNTAAKHYRKQERKNSCL